MASPADVELQPSKYGSNVSVRDINSSSFYRGINASESSLFHNNKRTLTFIFFVYNTSVWCNVTWVNDYDFWWYRRSLCRCWPGHLRVDSLTPPMSHVAAIDSVWQNVHFCSIMISKFINMEEFHSFYLMEKRNFTNKLEKEMLADMHKIN